MPNQKDNAPGAQNKFWEHKTLEQMTEAEWESLCDGCGQCCLLKLEDEDTEEIHQTRLACRLLDIGRCRCVDYDRRHQRVPDCLRLTPDVLASIAWLPRTCAYGKIARGEALEWWHPLLSGRASSVHEAGVSVRGFAISEEGVPEEFHGNFVVEGFEGGKK